MDKVIAGSCVNMMGLRLQLLLQNFWTMSPSWGQIPITILHVSGLPSIVASNIRLFNV